MENWLPVIAAAFASPVLVKLIEALITKLNKKETLLDRIEKRLDHIEGDILNLTTSVEEIRVDLIRTNIMLLIHAYPDHPDIPKLAEKYVVKYNGNSYVVPLIRDWYSSKGFAFPGWLSQAIIKHGEQK